MSISGLGVLAESLAGGAISNWPAPPTWSPRGLNRGATTMTDVSSPLPFIGVTPCRMADTRGNGFTGAYGPPSLAANATRSFTVTGQCGIPASAAAVSFNFAALDVGGAGDLRVFPAGAGVPLVSTLNYNANTPNIANAAVVPLGTGGAITVQADAVSINLIIDINGYYASAAANQGNPFKVLNSGGSSVPAIWGETTSTATSAAGVRGVASAGTGQTFGVAAVNNSNGDGSAAVVGNSFGNTGLTYGLFGNTSSTGAGSTGVWGQAYATTGQIYGVQGLTSSISLYSSGVWGQAQGATGTTYGVRGTTASNAALAAGVYGEASQAAADAGSFSNNGIDAVLATWSAGTGYGLKTSGAISGASLSITGTKNFVAPHPLDPSREIRYASVEAPTVDVYFRGTATLSNGYGRIEVPEHFRLTAREGTYMATLTPVGRWAGLVIESEGPEGIVVRGSGSTRFHYVVYAERAEIEGYEPVQDNVHFTPEAMEKLHMLKKLPPSTKALLIRNGTLNSDGSYNPETARAMGWTIPDPASRE
jgi:hypothetical protein